MRTGPNNKKFCCGSQMYKYLLSSFTILSHVAIHCIFCSYSHNNPEQLPYTEYDLILFHTE
jgi:hypothetical protein